MEAEPELEKDLEADPEIELEKEFELEAEKEFVLNPLTRSLPSAVTAGDGPVSAPASIFSTTKLAEEPDK